MTPLPIPEGAMLVEQWSALGRCHKSADGCPQCGEDCTRIAITSLVYSFERCSCDAASYEHLVETLWHRSCFAQRYDGDPIGVAVQRVVEGPVRNPYRGGAMRSVFARGWSAAEDALKDAIGR